MPTAEGVFPKVGADPLYYSEANIFASRTFYAAGSTASFLSGTAIQTMGSILISAGSLSNPASIVMLYRANTNIKPNIIISGLSTNSTYSGGTFFDNTACRMEWLVGSPFNGYYNNMGWQTATATEGTANISQKSQSIVNLDTGSPVVIILMGTLPATGAYFYTIYADGKRN